MIVRRVIPEKKHGRGFSYLDNRGKRLKEKKFLSELRKSEYHLYGKTCGYALWKTDTYKQPELTAGEGNNTSIMRIGLACSRKTSLNALLNLAMPARDQKKKISKDNCQRGLES